MRAHRTDLVSFAFGLLFLAFAAWWLLAQVLGLVLPPVGWFLAGGLILVGGLGLIGALRSSRHNSQPAPADTAGDASGAGDKGTAADTLPELADPDDPPAPTGRYATDDTEPQEDRTLDLFGGDETPPPGQPRRDA